MATINEPEGTTPSQVAEVKTPLTRLLDLTAGWMYFVDQESDDESGKDSRNVTDPAVSFDDLYNLYQEAGALMGEEMTPQEEAQRVREFIEGRVLPLVLREPVASSELSQPAKAS